MLMEQATKPERILKLLQGTTLINSKTDVSIERWNSPAEFHGKNDQPRKKIR